MQAGGGGKFGSMNVTPMIDVLLVLLVIFMIITPVASKGDKAVIPQPPPKNAPQQQQNNRSVVVEVSVTPQGQPQVDINQHSVPWGELIPHLINIYKTRAQKVLFVKADDGVPWQDVATVIDKAHNAGVDKVGLITAKIEAAG